jgi:GntR family transcriptional regulator, rspAB operon transcriptional repressor
MRDNAALADASSEASKSERVYRYLRRRIRDLEFAPGSRLQKNEIALQCGVSRAPVSEAIIRLASEGLIDVFPQSGSFVSPIRPADVRESLLIRTGLEIEAIRRVTQASTPELVQQVEHNLERQEAAVCANDMAALDDLDEAFHTIFFVALQSPRAQRMFEATRAVLDRPRFHALPEDGRPRETLSEHRRILDAIRTGDVNMAAAAMRLHLSRVAKAIERDIERVDPVAPRRGQ